MSTATLLAHMRLTRFKAVLIAIALFQHLSVVASVYCQNQFCELSKFVGIGVPCAIAFTACAAVLIMLVSILEWFSSKDVHAKQIAEASSFYIVSSLLCIGTYLLLLGVISDRLNDFANKTAVVVAAIEKYQIDHDGEPPEQLSELEPKYIAKANGDGFWSAKYKYSRYPEPQTDWDLAADGLLTYFTYRSNQVYPPDSLNSQTIRQANRVFLVTDSIRSD